MVYRFFISLILLPTLFLTGCNDFKAWYAVEFRQGDLTSGIARLSAQHLSMVTSELGKRFKDEGVSTKIVLADDPEEIGKGTVIKTLEDIELDSPEEQIIHKDCVGVSASWKGKFRVVRATQTIYGRLTNNPQNPIIPDPNSVKMTIHVKPQSSTIRFSDKPEYMEFVDGEISFDVYPRLAQAQTGALKGLRVIPTSNARYENIKLKNITGTLVTNDVTVPFDVSESDMLMQVGMGENGDENLLKGEIVAFGNRRTIPIHGNKLNPNYNGSEFVQTYACNENFGGTVEYNNVLFEQKIGPGVAGLTTLAMGKLATKLSDDYNCGLASVAFLRATKLTGDASEDGGSYAALSAPCTITFNHYRTEPDCFGMAHEINGEAIVLSASKSMNGFVFMDVADFNASIDAYEDDIKTGNLAGIINRKPEPILPKSRQPAQIEFTADLSNLVITEVCLNEGTIFHDAHCNKKDSNEAPLKFSLHAGRVSAKLRPMLGKSVDPDDDKVHMCAVRSLPIAETEFRLEGVSASIAKTGNEFRLLANGAYRAINGRIDNHENELSGEMKIGNVIVPFKSQERDHLPLKPDYEPSRFEESFLSCSGNKFIVPSSDSDCSLTELDL